MATEVPLGVETPVTLAATVERLTGDGPRFGTWLKILEATGDVYLVTADVADGASLPSTGRPKYSTSILPVVIDISSYGQIGLASTGAASCRVEIT